MWIFWKKNWTIQKCAKCKKTFLCTDENKLENTKNSWTICNDAICPKCNL